MVGSKSKVKPRWESPKNFSQVFMYTPSSNKEMVADLRKLGVLKDDLAAEAFLAVDRKKFLTKEQQGHAYDDTALPTLLGQTISQPYTVAFMLDLLKAKPGDHVLDIGSGSGWTTALLAHIVGEEGRVIGTEILPDLVEMGKNNLGKFKLKNAEIQLVEQGVLGVPGEKFDKILVGASSTETPKSLFPQLKNKGVLVVPVGESIMRFERINEEQFKKQEFPGFVFVPLL